MNDTFESGSIMNNDDVSVLRVLLHTIKGISPVAGSPMDFVPIEEDFLDGSVLTDV